MSIEREASRANTLKLGEFAEAVLATDRLQLQPERSGEEFSGLEYVMEFYRDGQPVYFGFYVPSYLCRGYAYRLRLETGMVEVPPTTFFANDDGSIERASDYKPDFIEHLIATNRVIE